MPRSWEPDLSHPPSPLGEVHVWRATLDQPAALLSELERALSDDEVARADRFRVEHGRRRYVAGRGFVRDVLSRYLARPAASLRFALGAHGKPDLVGGPHFNLAHSGDLALLAVTQVAPIGVDVEHVRILDDFEQIAERFFAPGERASLRAVDRARYEAAWFSCWTRKEAFIKAVGHGLSFALDRFEVAIDPDEPAALRTIDGDDSGARRWTVQHLNPAPDAVGAVAYESAPRPARLIDWQPVR